MSCKRCGMCCLPYSIQMTKNDDAGRWLTYHGLIIQAGDDEHMILHGQSKCHMLVMKDDGTTACGCYADRPDICKKYACERAKDE